MVKVEIANRILIQWDGENFKCAGPLELIEKIDYCKTQFGTDPKNWSVDAKQLAQLVELNPSKPSDQSVDFVLYKFIQKVKRLWALPYKHEELCHCRLVPTEKVTQAIEQGAKTTAAVARVTMAGTGCGTCRTDTETILDYYNFK